MPLLSTFGAASARGSGFGGAVAAEPGQTVFNAGSHTWTCPAGVTSVSIVVVGPGGSGGGSYGGGGGGGGLTYGNNIAVSLYCKHCEKQEWTFLTYKEYEIQKGLIENAIKTNE